MVANGASFVYMKASQGFTDKTFVRNWKASKEAGILRGAYAYLDWQTSELDQAKKFVALLKDDSGELPPMLDFEEPTVGISKDLASARALNFLAYVEQALGRIPGLYTYFYYFHDYAATNVKFARYPLWLASYTQEAVIQIPLPWSSWNIWQYTSSGDGVAFGAESPKIDLNYINGTKEELYMFANIPVPHPAICPTCGQVWPTTPVLNKWKVNIGAVNVRDGNSSITNIIGTLPMNSVVEVDYVSGLYSHIKPLAGFPAGGFIWSQYLTLIA
jgi:lysozyme